MDDEQFIPGIYNYCDRWCERCTMTSRCRLRADELEDDASLPDSHDPENREFWDRISNNFQKAFELIKETMDREGFVITDEDLEEEGRRREKLDEEVDADPLGLAGMDYGMEVHDWFTDRSVDAFKAEAATLETKARLELPGTDPVAEAERIREAVEVVQWYGFQIGVKIKRALSSALEDHDFEYGDHPSDADGSAKVALIGIDRSLGAWQALHEQFTDGDDGSRAGAEVFEFMLQLDRLRRGVEERFPKARTVRRPGFED